MEAELAVRFSRMSVGDKRGILACLNQQCGGEGFKRLLDDISVEAKEWIIDYETGLLEVNNGSKS